MPPRADHAPARPGQVTAWLAVSACNPHAPRPEPPNGTSVLAYVATEEAIDIELSDGTRWHVEVQQTRMVT
jgi:hypothetical protein